MGPFDRRRRIPISVQAIDNKLGKAAVNIRFYKAALFSLVILVSGTLLFPDTYANIGYYAGPIRINVLRVLFLMTFPSILLLAIQNRAMLKVRTLDVFLASIMLYINIRVVLATHQINSWTLAYAAYALLLYYGMAYVGQINNGLRIAIKMLITLVIIIASYAMLEFFLKQNILFGDLVKEVVPAERRGYHRSGSTIGHPVMLGLFLVQALPFVIYKYASVLTKRSRLLWGVIIATIFLALEVTLTKGAWITGGILSAVVVLWLWRSEKARKPMIILIISISVVVFAFTYVFQDSLKPGVFSESRTNESYISRLIVWERVPDAFSANPVFGAGMYQGLAVIIRSWPPEKQIIIEPKSIDNEFFTVLIEQGVVGTFIAGAVVVLIGMQAWKLLRGGGKFSIWAIPITISLSAVLIDGMTFNSMTNWPNMVVFWLFAGALRAMFELKEKGRELDIVSPI